MKRFFFFCKCTVAGTDLVLDVNTVFEVTPEAGSTAPLFLRNVKSTVSVDGGAFSFRNPPSFHQRFEFSIRDAEYETEALITYVRALV